ncbi:c-type cytochrome [Botrimarina mediterranea]|uniref:Cytochrome c n=1 Tax=Botrimarina mediterranea TaxID=2528022 RepID=A0A518KAP0_9BACT|nr:c-type cytochrome [Botrimarina mediterranea]QDV74859.1 Cytochrome c [Botrimarina mediterranea]
MRLARHRRLAAMLCIVLGAGGCRDRVVEFEPDAVLRAVNGLTAEQSASIDAALVELFGSPNEPRLPADLPRMAELCGLAALEQAAGPVASHEVGVVHGLYRRHCARCHGVTGDGRGPTARYQAPYPRDYRRGVFKWKSTYRDAAPTAADLDRVLEHGVPGTAMPSFRLVSQEERDILRQYVVYLAIRGQTERVLVDFVANELPAGEPLEFEGDLRDEIVADYLTPIVNRWADAGTLVVEPSPEPPRTDEGLLVGVEAFHGNIAGCAACHGVNGQGGAQGMANYQVDYDIWNRDRLVLKPNEELQRVLARDLPVRPTTPRELVEPGSGGLVIPHGGASTGDLYRRLHQGIAGTPMPAYGSLRPGERGVLSEQQIWNLVHITKAWMEKDPVPGD